MKYRPILINETLEELTRHGTDDFPISMDEQIVNDIQCDTIEHWHYEIQICLVTKGAVIFKTPVEETVVQEGEGFFINSGVLHAPISMEGGENIYVCVNFRPDFLYGSLNSLIRKSYVDPVLSNTALRSFALKEKPWQKEICGILKKMERIDALKEYGFEIEMRDLVGEIWQIIVANNRDSIEKHAENSFSDSQRIRILKKYIQQNYTEQISLADIAKADYISRGECCRVFKRVTGETPFDFLCRFRITQSLKLLDCSSMNISEIARNVGFSNGSYFTVCFKKELGCTPKEYRKRNKYQNIS